MIVAASASASSTPSSPRPQCSNADSAGRNTMSVRQLAATTAALNTNARLACRLETVGAVPALKRRAPLEAISLLDTVVTPVDS